MLHITVDGGEFFNDSTQEFIEVKSQKLTMEHSLLSISKWESKWKKPFLDDKEKRSPEEYLDYIKCMTITKNVDPLIYSCLSKKNLEDIKEYIHDPHTATTIRNEAPRSRRPRVITSELIYCWMVLYNIPTEYERWHLNRLMMLIRVCGIESNPKKKSMGRNAIYQQNQEINAINRAKYHSKG